MDALKEFVNALRNNPKRAYDYFAQNYSQITKNEMRCIILELMYSIYDYARRTRDPLMLDKILAGAGDDLYDNLYSEEDECDE